MTARPVTRWTSSAVRIRSSVVSQMNAAAIITMRPSTAPISNVVTRAGRRRTRGEVTGIDDGQLVERDVGAGRLQRRVGGPQVQQSGLERVDLSLLRGRRRGDLDQPVEVGPGFDDLRLDDRQILLREGRDVVRGQDDGRRDAKELGGDAVDDRLGFLGGGASGRDVDERLAFPRAHRDPRAERVERFVQAQLGADGFEHASGAGQLPVRRRERLGRRELIDVRAGGDEGLTDEQPAVGLVLLRQDQADAERDDALSKVPRMIHRAHERRTPIWRRRSTCLVSPVMIAPTSPRGTRSESGNGLAL